MINKHKIKQPDLLINETKRQAIQENENKYPCTVEWLKKNKKE